jgi:hypothetical protein
MDGLSRRELLRYWAAAAALVLAPSGLACSGDPGRKSSPRIAIVGAGLAGLSCAYHLHRHGLSGSIFEANPERIGGRCWTARDSDGGRVASMAASSSIRAINGCTLWSGASSSNSPTCMRSRSRDTHDAGHTHQVAGAVGCRGGQRTEKI